MKKALLIGDYTLCVWHPLKGVDEELRQLFSDYQLDITEDWPSLTLETLKSYDVVINYVDAWGRRGASGIAGQLLAYVALGGSMLAIHNGIITRNSPEMEQLMGGAFLRHPKHEVLAYEKAGGHPITEGFTPFEMDEEPYQFQLDEMAKAQLLVNYVYQGEKYPAAWQRSYGQGKMVYVSAGHSAASFKNEGFRLFLRRCAAYLCGCLRGNGEEFDI